MNDIKFNCTYCKQELDAPPDMAGASIACPSCTKNIQIPIKDQQSRPLKKRYVLQNNNKTNTLPPATLQKQRHWSNAAVITIAVSAVLVSALLVWAASILRGSDKTMHDIRVGNFGSGQGASFSTSEQNPQSQPERPQQGRKNELEQRMRILLAELQALDADIKLIERERMADLRADPSDHTIQARYSNRLDPKKRLLRVKMDEYNRLVMEYKKLPVKK